MGLCSRTSWIWSLRTRASPRKDEPCVVVQMPMANASARQALRHARIFCDGRSMYLSVLARARRSHPRQFHVSHPRTTSGHGIYEINPRDTHVEVRNTSGFRCATVAWHR